MILVLYNPRINLLATWEFKSHFEYVNFTLRSWLSVDGTMHTEEYQDCPRPDVISPSVDSWMRLGWELVGEL